MVYIREGLKVHYIGPAMEGKPNRMLTVKEVHTFYGYRSKEWITQVEVQEIPDSAFALKHIVPAQEEET